MTPPAPAAREAELRRLRKMNTEFEEQNAILQKHTESMNCAKEKLEQELAQEERQTLALQQQLQSVRQALTASFASLPIPGESGPRGAPAGRWPGRGAARGSAGGAGRLLTHCCGGTLQCSRQPGLWQPRGSPVTGPLEPQPQQLLQGRICPDPFPPGSAQRGLSPAAGDGTSCSGSLPWSPA